jgi:hypothetical protein
MSLQLHDRDEAMARRLDELAVSLRQELTSERENQICKVLEAVGAQRDVGVSDKKALSCLEPRNGRRRSDMRAMNKSEEESIVPRHEESVESLLTQMDLESRCRRKLGEDLSSEVRALAQLIDFEADKRDRIVEDVSQSLKDELASALASHTLELRCIQQKVQELEMSVTPDICGMAAYAGPGRDSSGSVLRLQQHMLENERQERVEAFVEVFQRLDSLSDALRSEHRPLMNCDGHYLSAQVAAQEERMNAKLQALRLALDVETTERAAEVDRIEARLGGRSSAHCKSGLAEKQDVSPRLAWKGQVHQNWTSDVMQQLTAVNVVQVQLADQKKQSELARCQLQELTGSVSQQVKDLWAGLEAEAAERCSASKHFEERCQEIHKTLGAEVEQGLQAFMQLLDREAPTRCASQLNHRKQNEALLHNAA